MDRVKDPKHEDVDTATPAPQPTPIPVPTASPSTTAPSAGSAELAYVRLVGESTLQQAVLLKESLQV